MSILPVAWMFQSTPSGRKATRADVGSSAALVGFNPRLPGGRRPRSSAKPTYVSSFQSTPSGRKATARHLAIVRWQAVSIHAFREEGDLRIVHPGRALPVSIHAFREEGDCPYS